MSKSMRRVLFGTTFLAFANIVNAAAITWTFSGSNTDLGNTSVFTSNTGLTITASGFTSNGTPGHLYGKNEGGDEIGLGMVADPTGDHEIYFGTDFVQLDLVNVLGKVGGLNIEMNSTTDGESWRIYDTSSAGTLVGASTLLNGSDELSHPISPTLRYLDIVVTGPHYPTGNVLLYQLTDPSGGVPEPSSVAMVLFGLGLVGARFVKARQRR